MPFLNEQKATSFAREWLSEYFSLIEDDLNKAVVDADILSRIYRLPDQIEVSSDGTLSAKGKADQLLRAVEFGSATMGVPRLSIVAPLRNAMEAELRKGFKEFK